jgi:flagellar basal-body rod protein FlgB
MLDRLFSRGSMPALEAMLSFASARQKVIAHNLANVETVGYKAKDLPEGDFRKAMGRAYEEQRRSVSNEWRLEPRGGGMASRPGEAGDAGILKHIENNVDLETEMGRMVRNQTMHSLAANLLSHQFSMLREAVAERVIA